MTSLKENFDSPILDGYRTVSGGYSVDHKDLRLMSQAGEAARIPLHFLARFSVSELVDASAPNATPISNLAFNERRPGDNWQSETGHVADENIPGIHRSLQFVCDTPDAMNEFLSTIERPFFAFPIEPDNYEVDISDYGPTDLLYMTVTQLDADIDLSQSWIMLSDVPNAPLDDPSWKMASLDEATMTGYHLTLPLSNFSSVPNSVASVLFSFKRTSSSGGAPAISIAELGVRSAEAEWRPMLVNTLSGSLQRSASSFDGEISGPGPLSQPQMIWANTDGSRLLTLGGVATAEFNSGSLPESETSSVRFLGGNSVVTPVFNANRTHTMSSEFSIACWVRLQDQSFEAERTMGIVSKYVEAWDDETESYILSQGAYRLGVTNSGDIVFQLDETLYTAENITVEPDIWYHIVVVRDNENVRFYVNDELKNEVYVGPAVEVDFSAPFAMATWSTGS